MLQNYGNVLIPEK